MASLLVLLSTVFSCVVSRILGYSVSLFRRTLAGFTDVK